MLTWFTNVRIDGIAFCMQRTKCCSINLLLEYNADINACDSWGNTVIHLIINACTNTASPCVPSGPCYNICSKCSDARSCLRACYTAGCLTNCSNKTGELPMNFLLNMAYGLNLGVTSALM